MRSGGSDTLGALSVGKLRRGVTCLQFYWTTMRQIFVSREMLWRGRRWPWVRRIVYCHFNVSVSHFSLVFRPSATFISKTHAQTNRNITQAWECFEFFSLILKNQCRQSFIIWDCISLHVDFLMLDPPHQQMSKCSSQRQLSCPLVSLNYITYLSVCFFLFF